MSAIHCPLLLDLTLDSPAENLALDEALLEAAEAAGAVDGVLRLWEARRPLVVLGRSSRVADEVDQDACRARAIPVLRRVSGGATVVAGPGCLMYAVVLSCRCFPELRMIDRAHQEVLGVVARGLGTLADQVLIRGISDLTLGPRKFSGNSLRCKREHVLYHGTLLYDFPLELIGACLRTPPRQPEYRQGRRHTEFVTNFPASAAQLKSALCRAWSVEQVLREWPREMVTRLAAERYDREAWNLRL